MATQTTPRDMETMGFEVGCDCTAGYSGSNALQHDQAMDEHPQKERIVDSIGARKINR
jgi:hypothetical protein